MADQRRPPASGRGPRNRGDRRPAAPLTGPLTIDDDTAKALALFNTRLAAQAAQEKADRRVQKAGKAKDDAAAKVRALEADTKASAEARAEAAAAYRAAIEAWERARRGAPDPAPEPAAPDQEPDPAGDADATTEPVDAPEADLAPVPDADPAPETP